MDPNWRPYFSDSVSKELESLRSENEKLRKVCEAAIEVVRRYSMLPDNAPSLGIMDLEKQLKEWKGDK